MVEFRIPAHLEDLELPQDEMLCVKTVRSVGGQPAAELHASMEEVSSQLAANCLAILEPECFDLIYSFIRHWDLLPGIAREITSATLATTIAGVVDATRSAPETGATTGADRNLRAAFSAACYFGCALLRRGEEVSSTESVIPGAKTKGRKAKSKKGKKKGGDDGDGEGTAPFEWSKSRTELCESMVEALKSTKWTRLWSAGVVDESVMAMFPRVGAALWESTSACRDGGIRRAIHVFIVRPIKLCPTLAPGAAGSALRVVASREAAAGPVAQTLAYSYTTYGRSDVFGAAVLSDLAGGDYTSSRDGGAAKGAAALLAEAARRAPRLLLAHLSIILPLLACPTYSLRSAVTTALGLIVALCFGKEAREKEEASEEGKSSGAHEESKDDGDDSSEEEDEEGDGEEKGDGEEGEEGEEEEADGSEEKEGKDEKKSELSEETRDVLLDVLASRCSDAHAFPRAAALRAWITAAESRALPLSRLPLLAAVATRRLSDKAAGVRRAAAQLLTVLIECNPFAGHLHPAQFNKEREDARQWLVSSGPKQLRSHFRAQAPKKEDGEDNDEDVKEEEDGEEGEEGEEEEEEEEEEEVTEEQNQKLQFWRFCTEGGAFATAITACIPVAVQLLRSATASDATSALALVRAARAFGVPGAHSALRASLGMVWSTDASVRSAALETFRAVYIDDADTVLAGEEADEELELEVEGDDDGDVADSGEGEKGEKVVISAAVRKARRCASRLGALVESASVSDRASVAELLSVLGSDGAIPINLLRALWDAAVSGARAQAKTASAMSQLEKVLNPRASIVEDDDEEDGEGDEEGDEEGEKEKEKEKATTTTMSEKDVADALRAVERSNERSSSLLRVARGSLRTLSMIGKSRPEVVDGPGALARLAMVLSSCALAGRAASKLRVLCSSPLHATTDLVSKLTPFFLHCGADYSFAGAACACLTCGRVRVDDASTADALVVGIEMGGAHRAVVDAVLGPVTMSDDDGADADEDWKEQHNSRVAAAVTCVRHASALIAGAWDGSDMDDGEWFPAAEEAVKAIFVLSARPAKDIGKVLRRLIRDTLGSEDGKGDEATVPESRLARCLFAGGQAALHSLVHVEALASAIKRCRAKAREGGGEAAAAAVAAASASDTTEGGKGKKGKKGKKEERSKSPTPEEDLLAQLGGPGAGGTAAWRRRRKLQADGEAEGTGEDKVDEEDAIEDPDEWSTFVADHELVTQHLLGMLGPIAVRVVSGMRDRERVHRLLSSPSASATSSSTSSSSSSSSSSSALARAALMCVATFCAVSPSFGEENVRVVVTAARRAADPVTRSAAAVALGDLASRHPNVVEPWTKEMYAALRDLDPSVRADVLSVLGHLACNDLIKVRGGVGDLAACLADSHPKVAALARAFFDEFARRGASNPVYAFFPDALSTLSRPSVLAPADFRRVMRYLLQLIKSQRHGEALAERVAQRFAAVPLGTPDAEITWKALAFCLGLLPVAEKAAKSLAEHMDWYSHALGDSEVADAFISAIDKARKAVAGKPSLLQMIDEWEAEVQRKAGIQAEEAAVDRRAKGVAGRRRRGKAAKTAAAKKKTKAAAPPVPPRRSTRSRKPLQAVQAENDDDDIEE